MISKNFILFLGYHNLKQMSHLTLQQRYTIQAYLELRKSITFIADHIGKHKSVISREIKRNSDARNGVYKADLAHRKSVDRHSKKPKHYRFTRQIREYVTEQLKRDFSPEQIVGRAKKDSIEVVSIERIYQFVWQEKKKGGKLYKHLRSKGKRYQKRSHSKGSRGIIKGRIDIEQRPEIVGKKHRIGDLEVDLVIGKDHKGALVTINDRATGFLFMGKVDSKESDVVQAKITELLQYEKPWLHTITSDNGKEFSNHRAVSESLDIDYYFAKPYHSWERGANENLNGLVRQYFPKKTNFENITQDQIDQAIYNLNNRPRKRYGYKTPTEIFAQKIDNLLSVAFMT